MGTQNKRIGRGSTCVCYRLQQNGRSLILKKLKKECCDPAHLERFRSAYALQCLLANTAAAPYVVKPVSAQLDAAPYSVLCEDDGGETLDQVTFPQVADLLLAVENAALALHSLHKRKLLYLDVKANNFLRCPDGRIKLFDFDSVVDLANPVTGTPLYPPGDITLISPALLETSPDAQGQPYLHAIAKISESDQHRLSVKTDLYGLGALLRTLLLRGDPCLKQRFAPEAFAQELHKAASYQYRYQLSAAHQKRLCAIMNKAMQCHSGSNYTSALDLAGDLKKLRKQIKDATVQQKAGTDDDRMMTAAWVLHQHPLFQYQGKEPEIHVLLVGDSAIAGDFFNLIFACAQMPDGRNGFRPINIHILTHSPDALSKKLKETGDLCRYLRMQHPNNPKLFQVATRTQFAQITMEHMGKNIRAANAQALDALSSKVLAKINPYTYILLLDEQAEVNLALARRLLQRLQDGLSTKQASGGREKKGASAVHASPSASKVFIGVGDMRTDGMEPRSIPTPKALPQVTCRTFALNGITAEQEQAFRQRIETDALKIHTYYTKEYQQRTSREAIAQTFRDSENKRSSVRAALSLPYKLYACGLLEGAQLPRTLAALQATQPRSSQQSILRKLSLAVQKELDLYDSGKESRLLQQLLHLEHRSWQCFALTQGWKVATDAQLEQFAFTPDNPNNKFRINNEKFHACLAESTFSAKMLPLAAWKQQDWARASAADELDKRSVFLHRLCCRRVDELVKNGAFETAFLTLKQSIPSQQRDVLLDLSSLTVVEQKLLMRQSQTDTLWQQLCEKLQVKVADNAHALEALAQLQRLMRLVFQRNACYDYKRTDLDLIRAMPMILHPDTGKTLYKLYSDTHWCNVVSAMMTEPERLVLLYDPTLHQKQQVTADALHYAEMFRRRYASDNMIQVLVCPFTTSSLSASAALDITGAAPEFTHRALSRNALRQLPTLYYRGGRLHGLSKTGPNWNMYNGRNRSLSVEESLALAKNKDMSAPVENSLLALHRDYRTLWEITQKIDTDHWCAVTSHIGQAASIRYPLNTLDEIPSQTLRRSDLAEYTLTAQQMQRLGLTQVLEQLVQLQILSGYQLTEGKLSVVSKDLSFAEKNQAQINRLQFYIGLDPDMENRYALQEIANPRDPSSPAFAIYDRCLAFVTAVSAGHEFLSGIKAFHSHLPKGQVLDFSTPLLEEHDNTTIIRFSFQNEAIRELLSKSGNVLEAFAYHAISNSGLFDDVKPNVYIHWFSGPGDADRQTTNEVDLICTKGMRTYYISCKRTAKLEQSFYDQVWCQAQLLGVEAVPILLWAQNKDGSQVHIARGKRMGVETIQLKANDAEEHLVSSLRKLLQP